MDVVAGNQARALEFYVALRVVRSDWVGELLLCVGLNPASRALALASLAAGAAGLFLEAETAELRLAQREGCCTFSVSTLEEAIRALKNEIRQRRTVSVALSGEPAQLLIEIARRGLQPGAIALARDPLPNELASCSALMCRGSKALQGLGLAAVPFGLDLGVSLARSLGKAWRVETDTATTMASRRERDRFLSEGIGESTATLSSVPNAAARWLRAAPSLFPRALDRSYLHRNPEF